MISIVRTSLATALFFAGLSHAVAQTFPSKQIDLIVPFVAGGTTDSVSRLIAQRMNDSWGQPAIVHNRPGGGSTIGTNIVAKAAADGHTLLVTTIAFAINASLQKTPYDPVKDFAPITELTSIPIMLVVHPSLPVKSVKELIEYSKAQPAGVDYASSGAGTSTHLAAEMFNSHDRRQAGARAVQGQRRGAQRAARRPCEGAFRAVGVDLAARAQRRACACSR